MLNFIHDNFLLDSRTAQRLYHQYAKSQPIIDYHSHLHAADVAINRRFENLFEIWLEGDHYKWRAMRANGISERLCAGSASPQEKFLAWAHTVPHTLRNPLYHWTHLELKRYFDIDDLLNDRTAESIWQRANKQLQTDEFTAQNILRKFQVRVICTSDDPADSLEHHIVINSRDLGFRIYPSFRPYKSLLVDQPIFSIHGLIGLRPRPTSMLRALLDYSVLSTFGMLISMTTGAASRITACPVAMRIPALKPKPLKFTPAHVRAVAHHRLSRSASRLS